MPYKLKDPVRHKFPKEAYNKRDWKAYEEGLRNRGDLIVWFSEDAVAAWNHVDNGQRKRGRQRQYSDWLCSEGLVILLKRQINHQSLTV